MCPDSLPILCKAVRGFPVAHDEDYIHEFHRKYPKGIPDDSIAEFDRDCYPNLVLFNGGEQVWLICTVVEADGAVSEIYVNDAVYYTFSKGLKPIKKPKR